jgi:hypothetical protein
MINRAMCATTFVISALVIALIAPTSMAQTSSSQTSGPKKEWPTKEPYDDAICAFDKALTKASRDKAFRARLTKSCESAKEAVSEIGNINIPDDRIIIFYEGEAGPVKALSPRKRKEAQKLLGGSTSSEKIHVFVLPTWKDNDTAEYRYEEYFVGMYDAWLAHPPRCKVP